MNKITSRKFIMTLVTLFILTFLSSCSLNKEMREYYSKKENYVNATGTITYIAYNDDLTALYLEFSELIPRFDDSCFKIVGDNLLIAQKNDIDNKLKIGSQVQFMTAPRYFGDGYVMPIVELSLAGYSFLEFEEGVENLVDWIKSR